MVLGWFSEEFWDWGDKEKNFFLYGFIEIPRADMLLLYNYLFSSLGFITTLLAAA
jgi:hypothetical protein